MGQGQHSNGKQKISATKQNNEKINLTTLQIEALGR